MVQKNTLMSGSLRAGPFRSHLVCSSIGIRATQEEAIELAHHYGFATVEARTEYLASLDVAALDAVAADLAAREMTFGWASLPVDFHGDEAFFRRDLQNLPGIVSRLRRAGVRVFSTWLAPCHDVWQFDFHFELHVRRLTLIADVLEREGFRLALEYLAPRTLRAQSSQPFVHTLAQTADLIDAIGRSSLGIMLDSFHWYTACETPDDLLALSLGSVLAVDLSDARAGIHVNAQRDDDRELPGATGIIDLGAFLRATAARVSDAVPVRAEPFNARLNELPDDQALAAVTESLRLAFALFNRVPENSRKNRATLDI